MPRDDGLRSLRCCKRRSIVSNLRGFGHKWSSSRQRIAILHLAPIRPDPYTTYSKTSSTSELALAAASGLSLQGHSVTLYTPGYRHKDIPDYLWDSSADIKTCLPRIVRLALFSSSSGSSSSPQIPSAIIQGLVALILSIRVIFHCIISFVTNLMWSLLPQVIQRARGGRTAVTTSISTSMKLLDVLITFESPSSTVSIPHILLSPFAKKIITISPDYHEHEESSNSFFSWFPCGRESDMTIVTTDSDSLMHPNRKLTTLYPPVVSVDNFFIPDKSLRPYFVALSWYKHTFSDLCIAIESFGVFLKSFGDGFSENEHDGSTGSLSVVETSFRTSKPYLVVADVRPEDYLLILREMTRFGLRLDQDVFISQSTNSREISQLIGKSIGVIHTPTEVNEIRIPCAAMLSSRPVVTTMSFCLTEPVRHESTGVLVKTASPHLVAQGIEHVYSLYKTRTTEWTRMGQRGKQRVVTEFSIEMFGSRLDDIIEAGGSGVRNSSSGNSLRPRAFSASSAAGSDRGGRTLSVQSGLSDLVVATSTTD